MTTALIGMLFCLALCFVALRANKRLRNEDRLPMQWLLNGEVTWSAPRPIALALIPALSFLTFAGLAILSLYARPRPGQENLEIPALIAFGLLLLASQLFHLWMIEKTIRRNDG